jgi:hypothetical protein
MPSQVHLCLASLPDSVVFTDDVLMIIREYSLLLFRLDHVALHYAEFVTYLSPNKAVHRIV